MQTTFSSSKRSSTISLNLIVPDNWQDLSDKQLRYVYQLIADDFSCEREQSSSSLKTMPSDAENGCNQFNSDELKTLCLLHWSILKVVGRQDNGSYLLKKGSSSSDAFGEKRRMNLLFELTPLTLAELLPHLDWLTSLPTAPVRISKINRYEALPADFSEVPFEKFLIADNLYQGYLVTQEDSLLDELAGESYMVHRRSRLALPRTLSTLNLTSASQYSIGWPIKRIQDLLGVDWRRSNIGGGGVACV